MTDRIDLDELADDSDDEDSDGGGDGRFVGDEGGDRDDWLSRDTGDTASAPATERSASASKQSASAGERSAPSAESGEPADAAPATNAESTADPSASTDADAGVEAAPMPHVPRVDQDKPVGIPKERGGAGGAAASDHDSDTAPAEPAEADGPHGGDADDMTMAFTYRAVRRLSNPAAAFADATRWTDWLGVVGDVDAHVITKFQRDHGIDGDFFNGSGTGPAERLAGIDPHSMFFADRMVLVGVEDEAWIATEADWEFVRLSEAAAAADWELAADAP